MSSFSTSIYHVVTEALTDLNEAQLKGKIPKNPLSETHFLAAWTTNAIKKKRFDSKVVPTLIIWQRKARSLGKNAALVETFNELKQSYEHVFDENLKTKPITKNQLIQLCEQLNENQWLVDTELEVGEKLNRHSAGQSSLIIDKNELKSHFEHGLVSKPISLYIRGDVKEVIQRAFELSILLYKVTDYKSKVKYHGEYLIYPNNDGEFLPERLTEF
jgi:hypothetical protein